MLKKNRSAAILRARSGCVAAGQIQFVFFLKFIQYTRSLLPRGVGRFTPSFFSYEKICPGASDLEASLIANRLFDSKEAFREAKRPVTIKKNPRANGDFSREIYPFVLEDEESIFFFFDYANYSDKFCRIKFPCWPSCPCFPWWEAGFTAVKCPTEKAQHGPASSVYFSRRRGIGIATRSFEIS
jgi:hypothetical protein